MGEGLGLDVWWDEPDCKRAERGAFILGKLRQSCAARRPSRATGGVIPGQSPRASGGGAVVADHDGGPAR